VLNNDAYNDDDDHDDDNGDDKNLGIPRIAINSQISKP
jgi:hypothetical protein